MTLEEVSGPPVEVWPDNWTAVQTFIAMSTQWRVGMAGATGLDYGVLPAVLRLTGVPVKERSQAFEGIRVMEDAVLDMMRSQNGR